jgi:DnaK suppressor protein
MDATDPTEPIERMDPAEPIDRIEPAEPIDKIEPLEPRLRIDPAEPAERVHAEPASVRMRAFSHPPGTRPAPRPAWLYRSRGRPAGYWPRCVMLADGPVTEGSQMDEEQARARLNAERAEVTNLLRDTESAGQQDREVEVEETTGDYADAAQPLVAQGMDDAIAESLRDRLAAIDRALRRLADGSYGRSVLSGQPIPDERLDADPAAELTVEEARAQR